MVDQSLMAARPQGDESGQALVETAIALPIYMLILAGLFFFGESYVYKIRVIEAARYAAMLFAQEAPQSEVEAKVGWAYFPEGNFDIQNQSGYNQEDAGDQGQNSTLDAFLKILNLVALPTTNRAVVTYKFKNPVRLRDTDPFTKEYYTVGGSFTYGGNPWAYDENGSGLKIFENILKNAVTEGAQLAGEAFSALWDFLF